MGPNCSSVRVNGFYNPSVAVMINDKKRLHIKRTIQPSLKEHFIEAGQNEEAFWLAKTPRAAESISYTIYGLLVI